MKNSRLESKIFYDLMHTSLCYTESNPYSRKNIADVCRKHMAEHIGRTTTQLNNPSWNHRLKSLKDDGLVHLGPMITAAQIEDIQGYFLEKPVYDQHHPFSSDRVKRAIDETHGSYGSFDMEQTLNAPHLLELALDDRLLEFAEVYLDCLPTVYSIHVFLSFPGHGPHGPQTFHRDMESFSSCTLMLFLSDVDDSSGPHRYILGSAVPSTAKMRADPGQLKLLPGGILDTFMTQPPDGYGHDDLYENIFKDNIATIKGAAGQAFMINPYGIHMGVPPKSGQRLMCWIRYGVMPTMKGPLYNEPAGPAGLTIKELTQRIPNLGYRSRFSARYLLAERKEWDALSMSGEYPETVSLEQPENPDLCYILKAGKITSAPSNERNITGLVEPRGSPSDLNFQLLDDLGDFNLVRVENYYFCIRKSLGPMDVEFLLRQDVPPDIFFGISVEEVKKKVEQHYVKE